MNDDVHIYITMMKRCGRGVCFKYCIPMSGRDLLSDAEQNMRSMHLYILKKSHHASEGRHRGVVGYHVRLTRERAPVRARAVTFFVIYLSALLGSSIF